MGMPKAWLPMGSKTVLQHLAEMLAEELSPVVVVASKGQKLPPLGPNVRITHDRNPDQGPLEGLASGLSSLEAKDVCAMVVACDVPLLKASFVRRLVSLLDTHDAAVPLVAGKPHPLVAVCRTRVLVTVKRQLSEGHLSMRAFLEKIDVRFVDGHHFLDIDPQLQSLRNINRPEDYRALAHELGFEVPAKLRGDAE